jgi:hypothetical protein
MRGKKKAPLAGLEARARKGDTAALHELYLAYARGEGVARDVEKAMALLTRAAEAGHAPSQLALHREIYRRDRAGALAWALRAGEQGEAKGLLAAGNMLLGGRGVPADRVRAVALLERAAALGEKVAQDLVASERTRALARGRSDEANVAHAARAVGLGRHVKKILALARPSVRLVSEPRAESEIPVGASKLGGRPDLPARTAWPRRKRRPLGFVAQLDLATLEAPGDVLPREGLLSFFYEKKELVFGSPGEEDGWRVVFTAPGKKLVRRESPGGTPWKACRLATFPELTLPPIRSALARSLSPAVFKRYVKLMEILERDYRRPPLTEGEVHRVLGHPDAIQGDMTRRMEYELAGVDLEAPTERLEARARTWRLLLQVDSDDEAGMMWGDLGRLYFWLRERDLAASRFERARLQLQCT